MSIELKIKSKHLGLEAKVIKFEEQKLKRQIRWQSTNGSIDSKTENLYYSVHNHRVWDVRNENRATFLARALIAGKKYSDVEKKCIDKTKLIVYIKPRIVSMILRYRDNASKFNSSYTEATKKVEAEVTNWLDN